MNNATSDQAETSHACTLLCLCETKTNEPTFHFYELTYEQTAGVSEGRLGPDEPCAVGLLRRAVDEAAPDPGGAHGQHPHEQPDVTTSQHHLGARNH